MGQRNRRRRAGGFYSFWSIAILFALLLVLFTIIFASCRGASEPAGEEPSDAPVTDSAGAPVTDSAGAPVTDSAEPPSESLSPSAPLVADPAAAVTPVAPTEPPSLILQETEDMGDEYMDSLVFMGDSTTYGMAYYDVVDDTQVWTPANGTFSLFNQSIITIKYPETGEELTIEELLARKQPEYLVITLGVNGVNMMGEEYFISEYVKLIDRVKAASPDTRVIVNSMYPVTSAYTTVPNSQIALGNTWLLKVAEQSGTRFLNTTTALANEYGYLPDALTNGDGLHLNPDGFDIILNYIRTHGYK